jgi:hypothetical protein
MRFLRRIAPIIILTAIGIALGGLMAMTRQGGVAALRGMAVLFLICDVAISSSLVLLLLTGPLRAPAWLERRLPASGAWIWRILFGLTVLGYAALAPTFLFFLIQMKD